MNVLVVDDLPELRAAAADAARRRGHQVTECGDAESAQAIWDGERFAIVLLDLGLPGMSGVEFCRWLRAEPHGERAVVIVITGDPDPGSVQASLDAGSDDFIAKPARPELLDIRLAIAERVARDRLAGVLAGAKLAEQERLAGERLRALVENGDEIISVFDRDFKRVYISPTVERVLGYGPDELLDGQIEFPIHPDDREISQRFISILFNEPERMHRLSVRVQRRDGEWRWVDLTGVNRLNDPAIEGIVINARDVTFHKRIEQELADALATQTRANERLTELNKEKSEFIAIVSHEFRTPLTSIQGFAEIMESGELDADTVREFSGLIHKESVRLDRLISEMLDLDRLAADKPMLQLEPLDLDGLLDEAVASCRASSDRHEIDAGWRRPLPAIVGDRGKLGRVIANVLGNAVKYSPDGGRISVRGAGDNGRVHLTVLDQGIGIPEASLEVIFQRYARVENRAHRRFKGAGMGLAVSKQIVELHGGRIWAESAPGAGSAFHIELPVERAPASVAASHDSAKSHDL